MSLVGSLLSLLSCLVAKVLGVLRCSLAEKAWWIKCTRCKRLRCPECCSESLTFHFRAETELRRAQTRRKSYPNELWASDFEALEDTERRPGDSQEGFEELQSHDPSSLPSDYELPRSYGGHRSGCDPASPELRPALAGSNICRRRGPLKLMSKLIS